MIIKIYNKKLPHKYSRKEHLDHIIEILSSKASDTDLVYYKAMLIRRLNLRSRSTA